MSIEAGSRGSKSFGGSMLNFIRWVFKIIFRNDDNQELNKKLEYLEEGEKRLKNGIRDLEMRNQELEMREKILEYQESRLDKKNKEFEERENHLTEMENALYKDEVSLKELKNLANREQELQADIVKSAHKRNVLKEQELEKREEHLQEGEASLLQIQNKTGKIVNNPAYKILTWIIKFFKGVD